MLMAKNSETQEKEKLQRGSYMCPGCKHEFEGTECPNCGNKKGLIKLAADGIDQDLHRTEHLLGGTLKSEYDFMTDAQKLERKRATMQMEEMDDNLREAYVLKSKLKLHDLEMQQKRKELEKKRFEEESSDYMSGRSGIPPAQTGQGQGQGQQQDGSQFGAGAMPNMNMPFMQQLSPQAIFMQQLMRMDGKKRAEFIEQLSEADPGALANLSAMFPQAPQQQPQQQYPGYPPNPYGQMMPPWMQPPAPQPQQHQTDPIALVTAIFELSQKMQPPRDDSMKETLNEFKGAIQKVHDRIDTVVAKERDKDMTPIIDKITSLEQKLNSGSGKSSAVDQITELTQLVDGLEKVGLVTRPGRADKTVDDELKIKEFEFKRDMKTKEMENEAAKIGAEQNKADLTQKIVSSLLQRGIQKGLRDREEENPTSSSSSSSRGASIPQRVERVRTVQVKPSEPVEIIDEVQSDAGIVRETRRPVKKIDLMGD